LELGIGERERKSMTKRIKYADEPLGEVEIVKDFLPPPKDLIFKEDEVVVKIRLRKSSIDFYKKLAKAHKSRHERVMRRLLDQYAATFSDSL